MIRGVRKDVPGELNGHQEYGLIFWAFFGVVAVQLAFSPAWPMAVLCGVCSAVGIARILWHWGPIYWLRFRLAARKQGSSA